MAWMYCLKCRSPMDRPTPHQTLRNMVYCDRCEHDNSDHSSIPSTLEYVVELIETVETLEKRIAELEARLS